MIRKRSRFIWFNCPYKIYNVGNNSPIKITDVIELIENGLGKKPKINFQQLQPVDLTKTYADVDDLIKDFNFKQKYLSKKVSSISSIGLFHITNRKL